MNKSTVIKVLTQFVKYGLVLFVLLDVLAVFVFVDLPVDISLLIKQIGTYYFYLYFGISILLFVLSSISWFLLGEGGDKGVLKRGLIWGIMGIVLSYLLMGVFNASVCPFCFSTVA